MILLVKISRTRALKIVLLESGVLMSDFIYLIYIYINCPNFSFETIIIIGLILLLCIISVIYTLCFKSESFDDFGMYKNFYPA